MKWHGALALLALAVCPRRVSAEDVLEKAAVFDPTVHFGDVGALTIAPLLQTRWTAVETGGADRASVVGFSVPRARLIVTASLFDAFRVRMRVGSSSNGSATFQQAYAEANWKGFRLRAGQMPLYLNVGEEPNPQGLSSADFSSYSNTFAGGQTQGVQLAYLGPIRLIATVGNGARSGFSELLSPIVADIATTGRVELPIGAQRVDDYFSEASFRKQQKVNARVGATAHFQAKRATDTPSNNVELVSCDVGARGSGFSFLASASYLQLAQAGLPAVQNGGLMVLASVLPVRRVELFAQFDAIWPLGDKSPAPPGFASNQPGTTMFRTLTVGSNYFVVPDVNRLKIQIDLQTMFDGETTSIIAPSPALGVLYATGPQVAARLQLVVAL